MPRADWKQDERDWAAWMGGRRFQSQGVAAHDIAGMWWSAESKSTKSLPAYIIKAFDQARINALLYPDKIPFVVLTYHQGKGKEKRYFLAIEVKFDIDDFDETAAILMEAGTDGS